MFQSKQQKATQKPAAATNNKLRQTFTNQDAINFMRRYSTAEQEPAANKEMSDEDRKQCFTDNYLVFNLNEKMPQLTGLFLEKEDSVLDYCKTVNFNRSAQPQ